MNTIQKTLTLGFSLLILSGCGALSDISAPNQNSNQTQQEVVQEQAKPEQPSESSEQQADSFTLYVNSQRKTCSAGAGLRQCLQVRRSPAEEWGPMFTDIEGFDYESGYEYELKVKETKVANPPADASSIKTTLIELISKKEAAFSLQNTQWIYQGSLVDGLFKRSTTQPPLSLQFSQGQLSGFAGCNQLTAGYEHKGLTLTLKPIATTKKACLDSDVSKIESEFLAALQKVSKVVLSQEQLALFYGENAELRFALVKESSNDTKSN